MPTKRNVSQLNTLTDQIIKKNDNAEITAVKDNSLRKDFIASFINWMTGGLLASSEVGYELGFTPTSPNAFARVDMIPSAGASEVTDLTTIALLEDDANWTDNKYTGTPITNIQKAGDWYISNSFFNKFSSATDVVRVPIQDMYSVSEANDLFDAQQLEINGKISLDGSSPPTSGTIKIGADKGLNYFTGYFGGKNYYSNTNGNKDYITSQVQEDDLAGILKVSSQVTNAPDGAWSSYLEYFNYVVQKFSIVGATPEGVSIAAKTTPSGTSKKAFLRTNLLTVNRFIEMPNKDITIAGLDDVATKQDNLGYTPENITNKGVAGGYASLDGSGTVPASQLPSYVDDVLEFADYASLPVTGEAGKIYVLITPYSSGGYTSSQFRWSGTVYVPIVASPGTTDALAEGSTNKYFTAARVLAVALTGYVLGSATAILASDTILQAFGKIEARLNANASAIATNTTATNANATSLLTKLTQGGDSPASTLRAGTNNAQALILKTNNVDRLTVDASGNIVQAGSTSLYDIVKLRIRDFGGTFKEVFSSSVTNVLTFASGWAEINFSGAWTQLKGTNSRMVEVNSAGVKSAVEEIIPFFIYNPTVQGLLSSSLNWSKANVYTGTSLSTYLLDQGQFYRDSLYEYTMYSTTEVVRKPLYRVARRLYNDYVVKNNVGATATAVYTYTIPANTLNKNGDALEIKFNCQFVNSSSFIFKINATTKGGGGGVGGIYSFGNANYKILRNLAGSQTLFTKNLNTSGGGVGVTTYSEITSFDETSDIIITVELQGAITNDVYTNLFEVDFKPSV